MKIIYIRASNAKGYVRIGLTDGEQSVAFTVSKREYSEAGSLSLGDEADADTLALLKLADERYRAKAKALRVLSYADNSEGMLLRKLRLSGISRAVADEVICEMVSLGYINSRRQLEQLVKAEVNKKNTGPKKLIPKLVSKGYNKSEIREVIDNLIIRGEIDFDAARERLLQGVPEDEVGKILYKNGYAIC